MSSASPATRWMPAGAGSSRTPPGTAGMKGDPLYKARRTLHTGASLLTDKQRARLDAVFASEEHVEVEATWGIYQRIVAAYREPDKNEGQAGHAGGDRHDQPPAFPRRSWRSASSAAP